MPRANLTSYGAVRDIEKWPARDRRTIRRDVINFEEYNPYITSGMLRAVDTLHAIAEEDPDAPTYVHQKAIIRAAALKQGIGLYNRFIVAALGAMLDRGNRRNATTAAAAGSTSPDSISPNAKSRPSSTP